MQEYLSLRSVAVFAATLFVILDGPETFLSVYGFYSLLQ